MRDRADRLEAYRAVVADAQILGQGDGGMRPLGNGQGIPGSLVVPFGCLQLCCLRVFSGLPVSELLLLSSPLEQQLAVFGMCRPECLRPCLVWQRLSCAFCAPLGVARRRRAVSCVR